MARRAVLCVVLGALIFGLPCIARALSGTRVTMLVDGKPLPTSTRPVLRAGRIYVPVTFFEKIGLIVKRSGTRRVSVGWPESDLIIDFHADRNYYVPDGPEPRRVRLPGAPFMNHGVLMVPLRALLSDTDQGTNLVAEWDTRTRTVNVHRSKAWLRQQGLTK